MNRPPSVSAVQIRMLPSGDPDESYDLVDVTVIAIKYYSGEMHRNFGASGEMSILESGEFMASVSEREGLLMLGTSKPDGNSRKLLDVNWLRDLGRFAGVALEEGVRDTYQWYRWYAAARS